MKPIRVLVVDDSQTLRRFALRVLEGSGRFTVCGLADDGRGVLPAILRHAPDVVLLDMQMPHKDGLEVTREIMAKKPLPVVLFCGVSEPLAQRRALLALEAGAVSLVPKPGAGVELETVTVELERTLEVAAGVRTLTRHERRPSPRTPLAAPRAIVETPAERPAERTGRRAQVIAIGASTGGPPALREVLRGMADPALPPVLVVQHIVAGFLENLATWLAGEVPAPLSIAKSGEPLRNGHIYLAPSSGHLVVSGDRLAVVDRPPVHGHRPSVDELFASVGAERRDAAIGVLLTGMGEDGARGLLELRNAGAETFAQDEATSIVYGMPRKARELGAARKVLPIWAIAPAVLESLGLERRRA